MKILRTPIAALLALVIVTAATAGGGFTRDITTETPPPEPTAAAQVSIPIAEPEATAEPLFNPATHANGYCEGYCWEGICPFFTGYPEREPLCNFALYGEYCGGVCWESGTSGICPFAYPEPPYTDRDIELLAKTVWGEARGCSQEEQSLVIWTILQRVDAGDKWGNTVEEVITEKMQFTGYRAANPVCPEIYALCSEELADWWKGGNPPTHEIYAPTVPYYFFDGDGRNNWFREVWRP